MGFSDLSKRVFVATILIALLIVLFIFAFDPYLRYAIVSLAALLSGIGVWEYAQFAKAKGALPSFPVSLLCSLAVLIVFAFFWGAVHAEAMRYIPLLTFFVSFLILNIWHFKSTEGSLFDLAACAFALLYIAIPLGMLLEILYASPKEEGRWWLIYLLAVTKITDIGAYFGGRFLGKRKLALKISPGKTVEGAVVGLASAVLVSGLIAFLSSYLGGAELSLGGVRWLIMGLVLGAVGQFGDLAESLLKRDAQKKDSNALPGFGGVLDLLDSIIYNIPVIYLFIHLFL